MFNSVQTAFLIRSLRFSMLIAKLEVTLNLGLEKIHHIDKDDV